MNLIKHTLCFKVQMMLGNCARALSLVTIISVVIRNEMNFMEIPSDGSGYNLLESFTGVIFLS
jgi:hypothetical protein